MALKPEARPFGRHGFSFAAVAGDEEMDIESFVEEESDGLHGTGQVFSLFHTAHAEHLAEVGGRSVRFGLWLKGNAFPGNGGMGQLAPRFLA